MTTKRTTKLATDLKELYTERTRDVLFHGWHHITFVTKKAVEFAPEFNVDIELTEAAALTHDLNYLVETYSPPELGAKLRAEYLARAGFLESEIAEIETVISQENNVTRNDTINDMAKVLSDADTLFKALPVTPILLAGRYLTENHIDINRLANNIVKSQRPLMDAGIYFYGEVAKNQYTGWAETNLALWENVQASLEDPAVQEMLKTAREMKAI